MCLIKGAFVGEKNYGVIEMHGTTIKKAVSFHHGITKCSNKKYNNIINEPLQHQIRMQMALSNILLNPMLVC